ncbi:hypothetical protein ACQZV8_17070 [Magnetococcales bacterium HHB-1]
MAKKVKLKNKELRRMIGHKKIKLKKLKKNLIDPATWKNHSLKYHVVGKWLHCQLDHQDPDWVDKLHSTKSLAQCLKQMHTKTC